MADKVNPVGGSGDKEGRDSACTPKWLAELLGKFDLDPCSNPRSHIKAARRLMLEEKSDGLYPNLGPGGYCQGIVNYKGEVVRQLVDVIKPTCFTFINPPYARGEVVKWVKHWRHTRFCFLLRWDPSTEWFAELICHCTHVWFPARRINFEPPPGVKFSSNPFPHALYLRDPDQQMLDSLSSAGYLMPIDQDLLSLYLDADEGSTERDDGEGGASAEGENRSSSGGDGAKRDDSGVRERGGGTEGPRERDAKSGCGDCLDCKEGRGCTFQPRKKEQAINAINEGIAKYIPLSPPHWPKWSLD